MRNRLRNSTTNKVLRKIKMLKTPAFRNRMRKTRVNEIIRERKRFKRSEMTDETRKGSRKRSIGEINSDNGGIVAGDTCPVTWSRIIFRPSRKYFFGAGERIFQSL